MKAGTKAVIVMGAIIMIFLFVGLVLHNAEQEPDVVETTAVEAKAVEPKPQTSPQQKRDVLLSDNYTVTCYGQVCMYEILTETDRRCFATVEMATDKVTALSCR